MLSDRYISDRFLPDKAIDLMDEASAKVKMEVTSKPAELERLDRKILQPPSKKDSSRRWHGLTPSMATASPPLGTRSADIGTIFKLFLK